METFLQLFDLKDILFHIINALILIVAARFLLYKPVRKFMDARSNKLTEQIDTAELRIEEANRAEAELETARAEAKRLAMEQQEKQAAEQSDVLLRRAQEEAADILTNARQEAEDIRRQAQEDIRREAVNMAVEMTEKMLGRELKDPDNQQMVRDFLTKVG